jgi:hypothetical protein
MMGGMNEASSKRPAETRSVADIEGPWVEPEFESGLIARCRQDWTTPVSRLSNQVLATFIRQEIGLPIVIPEAQRRVDAGFNDDSELYDGELAAALNQRPETKS